MKPKERAEVNKRYVGFVFQQFHLLDNLTVANNLDIPLSYRNVKGSERQAIVADTLDRFGATIVQVTHSEINAGYGNRIIRLQDGWMAKE